MAEAESQSRVLVLVRVSDEAEELVVLRALASRRPRSRRVFAPVFSSLIPALSRLAAEHRYSAEIIDVKAFLAAGPAGGDGRTCTQKGSAAIAIVALPSVDEQIVCLAEHLSGEGPLSEAASGDRMSQRTPPALVLFNARTPPDTVMRAIANLTRDGLAFGMLPMASSELGRLSLLKALLFPSVHVLDVDQIHNLSSGPYGGDESRPASERDGESRRILLVSGHGNSVDLGGRGKVVCPRGNDEIPRDLGGLYPCFGDGQCFRQPLFGRPTNSLDGLLEPALFRYPLVLLLGCATFPLGDVPFDRRGTMLWRMAGSDTLAAVATVGAFYHDLNVETALLSLLLDGHELGEAVTIFNAWHRAAYGRTSPAEEGYGPLVAIGNPRFRLESELVRELRPVWGETDLSYFASAEMFHFSRNGLALAKLLFPSRVDRADHAIHVASPLRAAAVRITSACQRDGPTSYISLQASEPFEPQSPVAMFAFEKSRYSREIEALRDSMSHLSFWRLLLGSPQNPMAAALGTEGESLVARLDLLDLERLLLQYLSAEPFASTALFPTSAGITAHDLVMDRWRRWHSLCLEAACAYVLRTGGFLFHLWQSFYGRNRNEARARQCPICLRPAVWLLHQAHGQPWDRHQVVQCPACGVIGELPFGVAIRADEVPAACRPGDLLKVDFEVRTERPAPVAGLVTLIREDWFHKLHDTCAPAVVTIDRGSSRTFSLELSVSAALPPGLYPLTLVAVLNGGLVQIRHHLSVL
jgi:hypothetical protein